LDISADAPALTDKLAAFASGVDWQAVPSDIKDRMKMSLLDAVAVMAGGAAFAHEHGDCMLDRLADTEKGDGDVPLVGIGRAASPHMAALVNGTLSEVLDFSDCVLTVRNHPGAPVIPGALSAAGMRDASGADFMAALAAGYEVFTRICATIQPAHWYRGFQATGTIGACGSSTAAARLLGADGRQMRAAIACGGFVMPVSNGDNIFRGHSVKPVHGGAAASAGLTAALLAMSGFEAGPLEGEPPRFHGPLPIVTEAVDREAGLAGLGKEWKIIDLAYKPFPCGLLNIGAIEICKELSRMVDVDRITGISVLTYKDAAHFVNKYTTVESSYVDCYLSLPYAAAATLIDGDFWLEQLEPDRISDPRVHELAGRIRIAEDTAMTERYPHEWPICIDVALADGAHVTRRLDGVLWSPRRPPSWNDIVGKFRRLAAPVYDEAVQGSIVSFIETIEVQPTMKPFIASLAGKPGIRGRPKG
jgi:2-methylcitrate dehydratase PrpD